MYLINTEIKVNWVLAATEIQLTYSDFDIIILPPNEDSQYLSSPLTEDQIILPTNTNEGYAYYTFMPNKLGIWEIVLTNSPNSELKVYSSVKVVISKNDEYTKKQVPSNLL